MVQKISYNSFQNKITYKLISYKLSISFYLCVNKWFIVNRIICIRYEYLKLFNSVQKKKKELVEKCYQQNMFRNHIFNIYV